MGIYQSYMAAPIILDILEENSDESDDYFYNQIF